MSRWSIGLASAFALAGPVSVVAKPIAFADGYTVMAEYGAGIMKELQFFYAPRYDFSLGGGHVELDSDETTKTRRIDYARLNYLVHRWNLDDAQANVYAWGGLGSATGNTFSGTVLAENAGSDARARNEYTHSCVELQSARGTAGLFRGWELNDRIGNARARKR
jgi:hypothetical protein